MTSGLNSFFNYTYLFLLSLSLIMALTTTVDRAISIYLFLMALFGVLLVSSMIGIIYYMIQTGFYPEEQVYLNGHWYPTG